MNRRAAKKMQKENRPVEAAEVTPIPPSENAMEPAVPPVADDEIPETGDEIHPLMAEVESFLSRRDELAEKLAEEIAATERKLAELKKTAASLFPERGSAPKPDGKAKKHKVKASRDAKAESANLTETLPPTDALG